MAASKGKRNALQTQKDGRLFAFDVLDLIDEAGGNEGTARPGAPLSDYDSPDEWKPYRSGPQWDGFQKALFRVFKQGTEQAQLGFCSVLTDVVTSGGWPIVDYLREEESAGEFQEWGRPGREWPKPDPDEPARLELVVDNDPAPR